MHSARLRQDMPRRYFRQIEYTQPDTYSAMRQQRRILFCAKILYRAEIALPFYFRLENRHRRRCQY